MQTLPYHIGNAWFDGLLPVIVRDFAGPALTSAKVAAWRRNGRGSCPSRALLMERRDNPLCGRFRLEYRRVQVDYLLLSYAEPC